MPLVVLLPGASEPAPSREDLRRGDTLLASLPWIAVLAGSVPPAHLELALSATLLVAAREAVLAPPAGRVPLLAHTGWRLSRRLGAGGALSFWTSSRPWTAARAARRGLVDVVADDPLERAAGIRTLLARHPDLGDWLVVLGRHGSRLGERGGLALERAFFSLAFSREDARDGARAFLERSRRE